MMVIVASVMYFTCFVIVVCSILMMKKEEGLPVGTPGFKPRIHPPYPQRVVKGDGDLRGAVI